MGHQNKTPYDVGFRFDSERDDGPRISQTSSYMPRARTEWADVKAN